MPVRLPAHVNPWLFHSVNGRMTTEAQAALVAAQAVVSNGRNIEDPATLTRAVAVLAMYGHSQRWRPLSLVFPMVGLVEACSVRRLFRGGLRRVAAGVMFRLLQSSLERELLQKHGDRAPGWNDYHMALWFMTGAECELVELHERATLQAATVQD